MSRTPIPDKAYRRIADIDIEQDICARGLRLAILDIDGTLKNRVLRKAPPDTVEWVKRCLDAGVYVCLVSNDRRNRHVAFSDDLDLPLIAAAHKPSPRPLSAVAGEFGVAPCESVVIGNNPFTDILGAHRAGMSAYLVRSIETTRHRERGTDAN